MRRYGGGIGGMAHLEGEAVVFVDEEVAAGEGDVVGELGAVLVDVVAVFPGGKVSIGLGGDFDWRKCNIPENISSLNSLHPFSNFSTGSQVRNHANTNQCLVTSSLLPFLMFSFLTAFFFSLASAAHLTRGAMRYSNSFMGCSFIRVSSNQSQETILTVRSLRAFWTNKTLESVCWQS